MSLYEKAHIQRTARILRSRGIEETPASIETSIREAIADIRAFLTSEGVPQAETQDDEAMYQMLISLSYEEREFLFDCVREHAREN